ncbi:MAG: Mrp/NBP35 family ATP-binding protein [bacterium]|nr:Mrp/NBP35 family ATP-binding protein [bacterium]
MGEAGQVLEKLPVPQHSRIQRVVAVMSGKGGVGKSTVTAFLAVALNREGHRVGILDADITGPSIPRLFGIKEAVVPLEGLGMVPPRTKTGVLVMSLNLFLDAEDDPVIWRGPLIAGTVRQFWTDVVWGDLDYLVIDLPPGTGDAPLTVLQCIPLDGLIVVTSPQDLAAMVVRKAIKMAARLNVRVIGLVENMAFARCPACGETFRVFGSSHARETSDAMGVRLLGTVPLDPAISELGDRGEIEKYEVDFLKVLPSLLDGPARSTKGGDQG